MKKHNFSSGPSILPQGVFEKASKAVLELDNTGLSILEISHRSKEFIHILESAKSLVLELLNLENKGYQVLFLQGGASMEFSRIPQNLLSENGTAGFITTGTWATNAMKEAKYFGNVLEISSSKDRNFSYLPKTYTIPTGLDYVHITSNNTIYGTQFKEFPDTDAVLVCDMSSDIFSRNLDFSKFGLIYAGAQKNLGPAGTTLLVIKEDILKNSSKALPSIMDYKKHIEKESMFNTPAVFPIYVSYLNLLHIKEHGGVTEMERRNSAKADLLYNEIDRNSLFRGTAEVEDRSVMNVTFVLNDESHKSAFDKMCSEVGISGINGHRSVGGYRASIYNAMPLESVEVLVDTMKKLEQSL